VKKMQAGEFKARCLSVVDDVNATGGGPRYKTRSASLPKQDFFNFLAGQVTGFVRSTFTFTI
jgi:hypothetical protein